MMVRMPGHLKTNKPDRHRTPCNGPSTICCSPRASKRQKLTPKSPFWVGPFIQCVNAWNIMNQIPGAYMVSACSTLSFMVQQMEKWQCQYSKPNTASVSTHRILGQSFHHITDVTNYRRVINWCSLTPLCTSGNIEPLPLIKYHLRKEPLSNS